MANLTGPGSNLNLLGGANVGAILQAFNDTVQAINTLNMTLSSIFPTATASESTSATAGSASALPGDPATYVTVVVNGVAYKAALWLP